MRRSLLIRVFLTLLILVSVLGTLWTPVRAAAPTEFFVEETGHTLGGPFLEWWIANDGQAGLGNPVTEPTASAVGAIQYFEYGSLVESSGAGMMREPAASSLLAIKYGSNPAVPRELSTTTSSSVISPIEPIRELSALSSGFVFHVDRSMRAFYEAEGGRSFFGRPISPIEVSADVSVQWFEYARIEIDESGSSLGSIGFELAVARGVDTTPVQRGELPLFNPDRYVRFLGDGTIPNAQGVFIPSRIQIPAIDVDALIEPVTVANGVMQVPVEEWNVGWYPSMSSPGEWSNVVMAGHRDWWDVGPVVFWNLDKLKPGDKIYVTGPDGSGATYEVTLSWLIDSNTPADGLIADTGYEALTLITCDGQWNGYEYTSRRIVRAKRI